MAADDNMDDIYTHIGTPDREAYDQVFPRNTTMKNLNRPQNLPRGYGMTSHLASQVGTYGFQLPPVGSRAQMLQNVDFIEHVAHHDFYYDDSKGNTTGTSFENQSQRAIEPYIGEKYIYGDTGEEVNLAPVYFGPSNMNTEIPTRTKNPMRPRTVAAAFDPKRHIITIIFRDGTMYNYYECDRVDWNGFVRESTKGDYIARVLDAKPRGIADSSSVDPQIRLAAVTAARLQQFDRSRKGGNFKPAAPKRPYTPRGTAKTNNLYTSGRKGGYQGKTF
jgi:hypothetical protein